MERKDWITGVAAVIAAVIGIFDQVSKFRDRRERILVRAGTRQPVVHHYTSLYVVNVSPHEVEIHDYGFVLHSGKLLSIPLSIEISEPPHDDVDAYTMKELKLSPRGHGEAGMQINGLVAGYYAITTTADKPVICFADVGFWTRSRLRLHLWWGIEYA